MSSRCGDGGAGRHEACDDGNDDNDDGCTNVVLSLIVVMVSSRPMKSVTMAMRRTATTLNTCLLARCGDGQIRAGIEECDDGDVDDNDGCLNSCEIARCGDAVVEWVEECDDGNDIDSDGCRNNCTVSFCGDGVVQDGVESGRRQCR